MTTKAIILLFSDEKKQKSSDSTEITKINSLRLKSFDPTTTPKTFFNAYVI